MTANELAYAIEDWEYEIGTQFSKKVATMLRQQAKEIEELKADAKRYKYLRNHCYKLKYPNSDIDRAMELNFVVSGVWSDNKNPEVLDGLIDFMHKEAIND
jgi:hypothetical protein